MLAAPTSSMARGTQRPTGMQRGLNGEGRKREAVGGSNTRDARHTHLRRPPKRAKQAGTKKPRGSALAGGPRASREVPARIPPRYPEIPPTEIPRPAARRTSASVSNTSNSSPAWGTEPRPVICTAMEGPASRTSPCGVRIVRTCGQGEAGAGAGVGAGGDGLESWEGWGS